MEFYVLYFFFFKQKTAYEMRISDWGSDVCSSDLAHRQAALRQRFQRRRAGEIVQQMAVDMKQIPAVAEIAHDMLFPYLFRHGLRLGHRRVLARQIGRAHV